MTIAANHNSKDSREKVFALTKDIKFCMMVTQGADGHLFARPMAAQERDSMDQLWFFTSVDSGKVREIIGNPAVLLSYSCPEDNNYVSFSGEAAIVRDRSKIDALWSESLKAWFPKGKDDPDIVLICVTPHSAEYWDMPSGAFVQAFGYLKSRVTGEAARPGENKTIRL